MNILFDHGTPAPLRKFFPEHDIDRSVEKGWELLANGELIHKAEEEGYDIIVTTDQNIRYKQNTRGIELAIVVLMATASPRIRNQTEEIRIATENIRPGEITEVPV